MQLAALAPDLPAVAAAVSRIRFCVPLPQAPIRRRPVRRLLGFDDQTFTSVVLYQLAWVSAHSRIRRHLNTLCAEVGAAFAGRAVHGRVGVRRRSPLMSNLVSW